MTRKKKRRRANGEGSVYQRKSGQWVVSLTVRGFNGSRKRISRNAKSAEHGRMILHELRQESITPTATPSQMTVRELVERWFIRAKKKWDISTADNHKRAIDKRIVPAIGNRQLSDITAIVIEDWVDWLESNDVGGRSQQQAFGTLSSAFNYAVGRKLMLFNPCSVVDTPQYEKTEILPFDDDQVKSILKFTAGGQYGALFQLAFTTGMRQSEIFGLQRRDFNPNESTIRVERQAREFRGRVTIKPPKTKAGIRVLKLTPQTQAMIEALPVPMKTDGFIFTSPKGLVIRRTNFRKRIWDPMLKELGIPHRGLHNARHTVATTMLTAGIPPITVSGVLGHASVSTTLNCYGHYIPETSSQAAEAMASIGVKFG